MSRLVSIFTGQFADIPLKELVRMIRSYGYDGVELCCWGDHMDVARGAKDPAYLAEQKKIVEDAGLVISALSCHLPGQLVCDPNDDERSDSFAPAELAGDPEAKRAWGIQQLKDSAVCARKLGLKVVNGFTGSSIWHLLYSFPPVSPAQIEAGYKDFAGYDRPKVFANSGTWVDDNSDDPGNTATFVLVESTAEGDVVQTLKCVGDGKVEDIVPVENDHIRRAG